jgi:tRNA threonylcarbamoyl adenosine modification protein (Sua5/YciO/YrdC/YwlC family)
MEVVSKEEFLMNREKFTEMIREGAIFIHPTDTIYGIGCIAVKGKTVERVREAKKRDIMPFSIIVPNKEWIYKNCIVPQFAEEWIKKLPGAYTFIFKVRNPEAVAKEVNNGWDTIGVRIPKHWFSDFVRELGVPVITTSANISGEEFMTSMENLNPEVKSKMDFIIYEGEKEGSPSTIVNLSKEQVEIITRGKTTEPPEKSRNFSAFIKNIVRKR